MHILVEFVLLCSATTAVPVKNTDESGGKHWKYERMVTVAMVGLIPAGFIYPSAVVDYGLAVALPLHGHWWVDNVNVMLLKG